MNTSTGNMYGFIDKTYNPIKGSCRHDCCYCYMKAMRRRFNQNPVLRIVPQELKVNLGNNQTIFVGSSTDMFADDVPSEWILKVLDHLMEYPDNTYFLQSKNPARFHEFMDHPIFQNKENVVFCTTIETDIDFEEVSKAPHMKDRANELRKLSDMGFKTMVTVEPIMEFLFLETFAELIISAKPIQVNIGANSARNVALYEPDKFSVMALISELEAAGITVHQKSNLQRLLQ